MRVMIEGEWKAFLSGGPRSAVLSTSRKDGAPHAVPLWYLLDGDTIAILAPGGTAKVGHLRRDPRATLTVHDDNPPYSFVTVRGVATLSEDLTDRQRVARSIAERYLGTGVPDAIDGFVGYASQPGSLLIRITPDRVVAVANVAEP